MFTRDRADPVPLRSGPMGVYRNENDYLSYVGDCVSFGTDGLPIC